MSTSAMASIAAHPGFASFDEAYRAHVQDVARWARQLGGPSIDVEDAVQEIFLVVSRQLPRFRGEARFTSWLFEITRRVVANHRRRHRWRFWTGKSESSWAAVPSLAPDPLAAIERKQSIAVFYAALDRLPEKYRTVLVLYELEGMSTQNIADFLGRGPSTVRVQLLRAREMFTTQYQQHLKKGKS